MGFMPRFYHKISQAAEGYLYQTSRVEKVELTGRLIAGCDVLSRGGKELFYRHQELAEFKWFP